MMAIFILETLGELLYVRANATLCASYYVFFPKPTIPLRLDLITLKIDLSLSVAIFGSFYFAEESERRNSTCLILFPTISISIDICVFCV
jgi:hypothetical protein